MQVYTKEDMEKAFIAGSAFQVQFEQDELDKEQKNINPEKLDFDEWLDSINKPIEEKTYPFTAFHLKNKLGWEKFCDLTGINYYAKKEGHEIEDEEVFRIPESKAREYKLI